MPFFSLRAHPHTLKLNTYIEITLSLAQAADSLSSQVCSVDMVFQSRPHK